MEGPAATDKSVARLLALLAAGAAIVQPAARGGLLLVKNQKGAISVEAKLLAGLASEGSIVRRGDCISATQAGPKAAMRKSGSQDGLEHRRREIVTVTIDDGMGTSVVAGINLAESPLGQLMRLKSKDGRPFLSRAEFDAGERLRGDYTRGSIMPRLGANWEANAAAGRRGERRHGGTRRGRAGGAPARRPGAEGCRAGTVGSARRRLLLPEGPGNGGTRTRLAGAVGKTRA